MIRLWAALLAAAVAGCASPGPSAESRLVTLRNPGFEADGPAHGCAPGWRCSSHSDPNAFRHEIDGTVSAEGQRSLRIERVREEPWTLVMQHVIDPTLRGARLRFTLAVRTEGATGNGGGPFVLVHGPGGATVHHDQKLTSGTADWKRVSVEFDIPVNAESFEVGAMLEGPGKLWIDAARLEHLGATAPAKKLL
ncbi:hypothetical protein DSM104443_02627 [Usitatibacter rugosus]|uniref:CBM-cenC domain-containing protein n=1 Tax=Usitatibacter rugosus TaxID=2732067 RepID=A0A6M4GWC8_9PROT|nr:hypothetical protein [Usitatibacter rugosus]QJR11549.1 hypothetical protein DSM104443_02627 [Usitatibacter rugosus]